MRSDAKLFDQIVERLESGYTLELVFQLNGPLVSRHTVSMHDGLLHDLSSVDGSETVCAIEEYEHGFYGRLINAHRARIAEEWRTHDVHR